MGTQRSPRSPSWFKGAYFQGKGEGKGREGEERKRARRGRPLRRFLDPPLLAVVYVSVVV